MDEIIKQLKNRNSTVAYHALHKMFFDRIKKHVRQNSSTDPEIDAATLFNDVYMSVENKVASGKYNNQNKFKAWFMIIVRNQWVNCLRKRPKKLFGLEEKFGIVIDRADETPSEVWEEAERQIKKLEVYLKCFDGLGSPCREILTKSVKEEKSIREIAIEMGYYIPDETVFNKKLNRDLTEDKKLHNAENVVKNTKSRCKKRLEACVQTHYKAE